MPESPTKRAQSPQRRASSPWKRTESPSSRRSPTKGDIPTAPEVKEQARQVLEKFLKRSLSQNDAHHTYVQKLQKNGGQLKSVHEHETQLNIQDDTPTYERRDSYVAAMTESAGYSHGNVSSGTVLKAHSVTVTKIEQQRIRQHCRESIRKSNPGSSFSPTSQLDQFDLSPVDNNRTTKNDPKAEYGQDSDDDDDDDIQRGRKKKSKFSLAKSRIQQSFLRKQRELRDGEEHRPNEYSKTSLKTPSSDTSERQGIQSGASLDIEAESKAAPSVDPHRNSARATSSPEGLNRINTTEKKTKTSFWDWLLPQKKKYKRKERAKSKSVDTLSDPAYSVQFSSHHEERFQNGNTTLIKRHSLRGRCSFRHSTNVDRTNLQLPGLTVSRPRIPGANVVEVRGGPFDSTDGAPPTSLSNDIVTDGDPPDEIPFSERSEAERHEVYDRIATRLADIADAYRDESRLTSPSSDGATAPIAIPSQPAPDCTISSLERDIALVLREKGDAHGNNEDATRIIVEAAKTAGYKKFKKELKKQLDTEPSVLQFANWLNITRGMIQVAGAGGNLAIKVKEFSLQYFEDKFAEWLIGRGGWDSMLSGEDEGDGEVG